MLPVRWIRALWSIQYEYKGKKYNFMDTYDDYDPSVQEDDDDDEGIE